MVFKSIARAIVGDPNKREIEKIAAIVDQINDLEASFEQMETEALAAKSDEFRARLGEGETLDDILPEAFATVREVSKRTIGLRHYDVQMIGGIVLHQGKIAEMRTGEGKTLVATLPVYLNALTGRGVHLITVNDYLARRDARWMAPIYSMLGLKVGVLQMASRTENGRKAFVVDMERTNAREDLDQLAIVDRGEAYKADIVYGTNSEFGFDYLRDNLTMSMAERVQRGHYYAIVDEVDNILIDEARTPLIISGPASDKTDEYVQARGVIERLNKDDYEVNEKDHQVSLTEAGQVHVEQILGLSLGDPERPEDITSEQANWLGLIEQALRAEHLYRRNKDYIVQNKKVTIVDEFTGRLMPGRRWSEGLHQAVEAKEKVNIEPENITHATITIQNYFRMYEKLSGMTGTALTEAEEFSKIYDLEVLPIPMNLEYQASMDDSPLVLKETKDARNYPLQYYTRREEPSGKPIFWRRQDFPDQVYRTEEGKLRAITVEIIQNHVKGRPLLVGTTSVEHSERLSSRLAAEPLRRLLQVLLIRNVWIEKNAITPELEIKELTTLNRSLHEINTNELRQFAREAGLVSINPEDPGNIDMTLKILDLDASAKERLSAVLQGGIPHKVLNARKHDEESQIIAKAGAFGAVTIATNMAGRGVDIKLGGELDERIIETVNIALQKGGVQEPYDLTNDERSAKLQEMDLVRYSKESDILNSFIEYVPKMKQVRELGGLQIIGSERHESRRIDNQLRGRAARQGDPGASRFYLSLEDELMRLFGGVQMENIMGRLRVDPSLPIEHGIIGRMVEQAQERVEGNNFDVRKHLLEYDDVLNAQRQRIYGERDRALTKDDLHEDVQEILRSELQERIPKALNDEEGPWKLLAFLDEVQPSMAFPNEDAYVPSFALHLIADELVARLQQGGQKDGLKGIAVNLLREAVIAENEHIRTSSEILLEKTRASMEQMFEDRRETLDTYFEGLEAGEEEGMQPRRPQEMVEELSSLVHTRLRLTNEEQKRFVEADDEVKVQLEAQISADLTELAVNRVTIAFERRLGDSLGLDKLQLVGMDWPQIESTLMQALEERLEKRLELLLSDQGLVTQKIDATLSHIDQTDLDEDDIFELLMNAQMDIRTVKNLRTQKQELRRVTLLSYLFLAAQLIQNLPNDQITEDILIHLEDTRDQLEAIWGRMEFERFRLNGHTVSQLVEPVRKTLTEALGEEQYAAIEQSKADDLDEETQVQLTAAMGKHVQNGIYRHLLVGVISELWVDYLTRVDALRVSIGLEAFAQRDPLVQYKSKAVEMFKELLSEIRLGVVSRMFVVQPRRSAPQQPAAGPSAASAQPAAESASAGNEPHGKKKRKRH